jgi:hypothetical protein
VRSHSLGPGWPFVPASSILARRPRSRCAAALPVRIDPPPPGLGCLGEFAPVMLASALGWTRDAAEGPAGSRLASFQCLMRGAPSRPRRRNRSEDPLPLAVRRHGLNGGPESP